MPNWVSNLLHISGEQESVEVVVAQLSQPYTTNFPETNYNQQTEEWEQVPSTQTHEAVLSFWNIAQPSDLEAYYGGKEKKPPKDATFAETLAVIQDNFANSNDWYSWNVRNWGTKWEAEQPTIQEGANGVVYQFDTAWSPPLEAMLTLSQQHPSLTLTLIYQEEFGWGGEVKLHRGEITFQKEWESFEDSPLVSLQESPSL